MIINYAQTSLNNSPNSNPQRWAAVVLIAGAGKRMQSNLPKPLHLVGGRAMILRIMDAPDQTAIDLTVLVVGYKADQIRQAILSEIDNSDNLLFARQSHQLGTGDATFTGLNAIKKDDTITNVIVLNGDMPLIQPETITKLIATHQKTASAMTFLTAHLDKPFGYGRVLRTNNENVVEIIEESDATLKQKAIQEVNAGIYCFQAELLREILLQLQPNNSQSEFYLTDTVKLLVARKQKVSTLTIDDSTEILGVNNKAQLADCEAIISRRYN